jgi:hypothetical protein
MKRGRFLIATPGLPRATASLARPTASRGVCSSAVRRPSRLGLKQAETQQPPPQRLERLQQQAPLR